MSSPSLFFILQISLLIVSTLSSQIHDVIIIGAGASGISAFSELLKHQTDVLVLEVENRIGGRINSVKFGEGFVDLGGQWVQWWNLGIKGYESYDLAHNLGLLEKSNFSRMMFYYSNKQELPKDLIEKFQEVEMEVYKCRDVEEGINLGDFSIGKFREVTKNLKIPKEFPSLLEDLLEHLKKEILAGEGAFDWNEPSAKSDSLNCDPLNYNWKGRGYKTILDILLKKIPNKNEALNEGKILLNKEVLKISWDNSNNLVDITCKDNTKYQSKKVIFTPSIGVLKAKMNEIFYPNLPINKQQAVRSLGIGGVAKVYLEYSEEWWDKGEKFDLIQLIWEKNMRKSLSNFTVDGNIWITDMSTILRVESIPKILCIWFVGVNVPFIETMDEGKLMEGIQFTLGEFLGHKYEIGIPIRVLRSKWYTNKNFLGTYSFQTVASRKISSNNVLGEPLKNTNGKEVLYFAGEATCPIYYGTVHGAIHTGFRESVNVRKSL